MIASILLGIGCTGAPASVQPPAPEVAEAPAMKVTITPDPSIGRALALDPASTWLLHTDGAQLRWMNEVLIAPQDAPVAAPAAGLERALADLTLNEAWLVTWGDMGEGPLQAHRAKPGNPLQSTSPALKAAGCEAGHAACDARARAVAADGEGAWIGGWYGIHSNEAAFAGWVLRLDASGNAVGEWTIRGAEFETSVDAIAPTGGGGALIAGHSSLEGGDRSGLWVAAIDAAGKLSARIDLADGDPLWDAQVMALAANPGGGGWLALAADPKADAVRLEMLGADGTVRGSYLFGIGTEGYSLPPLQIALTPAEGGGVLLAVLRGSEGERPAFLQALRLTDTLGIASSLSAPLPDGVEPDAIAISPKGEVKIAGSGFLLRAQIQR